MRFLRVAACQILTCPDVAKSTAKVIEWMETAAADKVDVIVFPEACLCAWTDSKEFWNAAVPEDFQAAEAQVAEKARALNLAVVLGSVHWQNGARYNSLLLIDKDGSPAGRYAKTHLVEDWAVPGRALPLFTLAGVKCCCIVCHDVRYPELVRLPAAAGAQICYYCSNEDGMQAKYKFTAYRAMPIARAAENAIFVVMANPPGDLENPRSVSQSHGNSKIVAPDGIVLAEAGHFEERLVAQNIDPTEATGEFARRAVEDDSALSDWMRSGVAMVGR